VTPTATKTPTPHAGGEADLKRYTPEQVIELGLLPSKSARVLREKCYRRELHHHNDFGVITFTAEDIRLNTALGAVTPIGIAKPKAPKSSAKAA
jgi:hypothetical protein